MRYIQSDDSESTTTSDISYIYRFDRDAIMETLADTLIIFCILRISYFTHILYFYILRFMYFTFLPFLVLHFAFHVFYNLHFMYFTFYTYFAVLHFASYILHFTLYILRFMYICKSFVFYNLHFIIFI